LIARLLSAGVKAVLSIGTLHKKGINNND